MENLPEADNGDDVMVVDEQECLDMQGLADWAIEVLYRMGFVWSRVAGRYAHYMVYKKPFSSSSRVDMLVMDTYVTMVVTPAGLTDLIEDALINAGLDVAMRTESFEEDRSILSIVAGDSQIAVQRKKTSRYLQRVLRWLLPG